MQLKFLLSATQLQSLQKHLHNAMLEYFKYRGLYNQGELGRMERESLSIGMQVSRLQEEMDSALVNIAEFLQSQLDPGTIRKLAMDKVEREEQEMITRHDVPSTAGQPVVAT